MSDSEGDHFLASDLIEPDHETEDAFFPLLLSLQQGEREAKKVEGILQKVSLFSGKERLVRRKSFFSVGENKRKNFSSRATFSSPPLLSFSSYRSGQGKKERRRVRGK